MRNMPSETLPTTFEAAATRSAAAESRAAPRRARAYECAPIVSNSPPFRSSQRSPAAPAMASARLPGRWWPEPARSSVPVRWMAKSTEAAMAGRIR